MDLVSTFERIMIVLAGAGIAAAFAVVFLLGMLSGGQVPWDKPVVVIVTGAIAAPIGATLGNRIWSRWVKGST